MPFSVTSDVGWVGGVCVDAIKAAEGKMQMRDTRLKRQNQRSNPANVVRSRYQRQRTMHTRVLSSCHECCETFAQDAYHQDSKLGTRITNTNCAQRRRPLTRPQRIARQGRGYAWMSKRTAAIFTGEWP